MTSDRLEPRPIRLATLSQENPDFLHGPNLSNIQQFRSKTKIKIYLVPLKKVTDEDFSADFHQFSDMAPWPRKKSLTHFR